MMNTAMIFLTCQKEPASLGFSLLPHIYRCDLQLILLYSVLMQLISDDRPQFRREVDLSQRTSNSYSISRPSSFQKAPSRTTSIKNNIAELKSFEVFFVISCVEWCDSKYHLYHP